MTRQDALKWLKFMTYVGIYGGLLMPMVFLPIVIFPFVFSKLIVFQVLIELTFPAYLILAWAEPKYRPRWTPLYLAIAAYFLAIGLSVIFAADPARAWWGNQERMNGLFTVLHFFFWLTMASSLLTTWQQWRKLLVYQVVISGIMATVALLQKPFPNLLRFPAGDRVGGLLDNPIYMAGYQIFSFFFIALIWLKGASRTLKLCLAAILLLDIGAFLAAQSRGALVGLAAGIVVFAAAYVFMSTNRRAKMGIVGLAILFFAAYGLLFALREQSWVKNSSLSRLTDLHATTATRLIAWKIGWEGFLERPLTGWGYDNFHILFNLKYRAESLRFGYYETWFDRAHNTVVDALAMTGLIGTLTYAAIWFALLYSVIRAYRRGWIDLSIASILLGLAAAYFVQNLFVFDQPAGFTMSFLMYAFIIRATSAKFVGEEEGNGPASVAEPRAISWAAFGILEFAALVLAWHLSIQPFRASMLTIKSNNYFSGGYYDQAFEYAKQASRIPTPYLDEQTFLQARNIMTLAEQNALSKFPNWREYHDLVVALSEKHLATHHESTHPHFIYARFLQDFSTAVPEDGAKAEAEYREALRTSPRRQQVLFSLARFYLQQGKKQEAADEFKKAADLDSEVGESRWYNGLTLMFDLGKMDEGAKELVASMHVQAPYELKEVREATALAVAYDRLNDKEGLKQLIAQLPSIGGGAPAYYLDIARAAERMGLIDERNTVLKNLAASEPSLAPRFEPIFKGSATSIAASLDMTVPPTSTASTVPATSSGGTGPRR
jgi:O-antigen ligase